MEVEDKKDNEVQVTKRYTARYKYLTDFSEARGIVSKKIKLKTDYLPPIVNSELPNQKLTTKKSIKEVTNKDIFKCYSNAKNSNKKLKPKI